MKKTVIGLSMMLALTGAVATGHAAPEKKVRMGYSDIVTLLGDLQTRVNELESAKAENEELKKKVAELEAAANGGAGLSSDLDDRLATLEAQQNALIEKAQTASIDPKALTSDIDEIYDTLDELETKSLQNRIDFGGEVRVRVDNYTANNFFRTDIAAFQQNMTEGMDPKTAMMMATSKVDEVEDTNNWSNRFRLNMSAKISDTLQFNGRLAMYKNWGDSDDASGIGKFNDSNRTQYPNSSNLWVDRAYVDWTPDIGIPFALTIGRQPSSEGPPSEWRENRLRQSTYPSLIFDGEADGIVATIGLERFIGWKNSGLRFAYGTAYFSDNDQDSGTPFPFLTDDNTKDSQIGAVFFETELPKLRDSLFVLSAAKIVDMPFMVTGADSNANLGDMEFYGAHLQVPKIMDSNLDVFASYGYNAATPNGESVYGVYGLLSSDGKTENSGDAIYLGGRYTFDSEAFRNPKIGLEYNHGSKYWFSMTFGASDLFNKLATRGDVWDLYYIQPVNNNLFFRAGYMHVAYDYTGSGMHVGEPMETDATLDNIYLLMDVRF